MSKHEHEFTALWWHFGPAWDQTVHVHSCFTYGCNKVVIAEGRACKGAKRQKHRRALLTTRGPRYDLAVSGSNTEDSR